MTIEAYLRAGQLQDLPEGQSHTVHLTAYGVTFQLTSNSREVLRSMLGTVPFGTEPTAAHPNAGLVASLNSLPGGESFQLRVRSNAPLSGDALKPLLEHLRTELMVYVADHAVDRVFVHAGVVGWQGSALIFPGPSFAGKTTLIAALVRAGATYYSDEYAVLDDHGSVHPYARDLQMREPGGTEQTSLPAASLSAKIPAGPMRVAHVIFATYVCGGHWHAQPVTAGMAVLEMLRHSIPVQRTPARVMATLTAMMQTATAVRSERGEAFETAESMLHGIGLEVGTA